MKNLTLWLTFVVLGMAMACSDDEPAPEAIEITAQDFVTSISENPDAGQVLGSITASTNRGTISYVLSAQSSAGAMALSNTGELTVADPGPFDFETNQTITATVTLTNEDVNEQVAVTINITDENEETITFDENQSFAILENSAEGITVGTVVATSSIGSTITYELVTVEPAALQDNVISIDEASGSITTDANSSSLLDFEQNETFSATIEATSSTGTSAQTVIQIPILDIPEIRFTAARFTRSFQENILQTGDELISWGITSDRPIESYQLIDSDSRNPIDVFTIDAANNRLLVDDVAAIDFELVQGYEMIIQANREGGGIATASIAITIGDDPSDNSILETADIYYNMDMDINNANASDFNGQFFGVGEVLDGRFDIMDRNGGTDAMEFTNTRVGLQPSDWTSDVHNGNFTISMWVKLIRAGSGSRVVYEINCGVDEAIAVFFETATGRLFLRQQNGTGQISGQDIISSLYTSVNDQESDWVFLTISVSADQIITDIREPNSTRFDRSTVLTGENVIYRGHSSTSSLLNISGERCNNAAAAKMQLDDVSIFNRALSADEITQLYNELNEQ